jgi:hypothetical protein
MELENERAKKNATALSWVTVGWLPLCAHLGNALVQHSAVGNGRKL